MEGLAHHVGERRVLRLLRVGQVNSSCLSQYAAEWKIALENVIVSPATTVTLLGKNSSSVVCFGMPAVQPGILAKTQGTCSPRNTL